MSPHRICMTTKTHKAWTRNDGSSSKSKIHKCSRSQSCYGTFGACLETRSIALNSVSQVHQGTRQAQPPATTLADKVDFFKWLMGQTPLKKAPRSDTQGHSGSLGRRNPQFGGSAGQIACLQPKPSRTPNDLDNLDRSESLI